MQVWASMSQSEAVKHRTLLLVCLTPPANSSAELLLQSMGSGLCTSQGACCRVSAYSTGCQAPTKASQLTGVSRTLSSTWPCSQDSSHCEYAMLPIQHKPCRAEPSQTPCQVGGILGSLKCALHFPWHDHDGFCPSSKNLNRGEGSKQPHACLAHLKKKGV